MAKRRSTPANIAAQQKSDDESQILREERMPESRIIEPDSVGERRSTPANMTTQQKSGDTPTGSENDRH